MTVYRAGDRGDALRLKYSGEVVSYLSAVGSPPGVTPLAADGSNGTGTGRLRTVGLEGRRLQWRAPGSSSWGAEVTVAADGDYVLEDGDDAGAWIRVRVALAFLTAGPAEALVYLRQRFNELGPDDVTAAEASAGDVTSTTYALECASPHGVQGIKAWLDAETSGLELSDDGATWVAPTSEGSALELGDLASGASVALYTRRTVSASATSSAEALNSLHLSWEGA